ncbi:MAG: zinc ribbon domain-containing protein [Candidatus Bathyarchaeota archaeon]|nr:zinc ribbon domain-containing protein [Candidatus Bathyarchaeota archaeon]
MQAAGQFCQSCGMPLTQHEMHGTDADGSKNQKYCLYCFKDGQFTQPDATLEQMIQISAKGWADQDPTVTLQQAMEQMAQILPNLERWQQ